MSDTANNVEDLPLPVSFQREVWETLSAINVNDKTEKKQNLTYLSWAWAWGILMENYPESTYHFENVATFPDGTAEVWVNVVVKRAEKEWRQQMWLPILNHKNQPIENPNAFNVNTARMRCLTKCFAMFGLGHYIYAGEDVPNGPEPEVETAPASPEIVRIMETLNVIFNVDHVAKAVDLLPPSDDLNPESELETICARFSADQELYQAAWRQIDKEFTHKFDERSTVGSKMRAFIKEFHKARP